MERSISQAPGVEHSTGELVKMMTEQVSVLVRDELKLAQVEMAGKGKQAAHGAGMFGAALLGRQSMRRAAPAVPGQAVAGVKADVGEVRERAHR